MPFLRVAILIVVLVCCSTAFSQTEQEITEQIVNCWNYREQDTVYQDEVILKDNTRADILSPDKVYEVDFAPKWYQAIGQSLHYSHVTGKSPGIVLILRDPQKEWRHLMRCATLCGKHGIEFIVWEVR